ncbi:MAG: LamG domain-containing protein [Flavobacteriales bacterium]|nr:LamG domain-containing protein [Flavobacteriales bacterium]
MADPVYEGNVINKEGGNVGYMLRAAANGTLNFAIGTGTTFSEINSPPGSMNLNTWYHIAGTYDGITQRAFINGVQVASATVTTSIATTANQLVIGDWAVGTGRNFPGRIDEVRIWNVALNPLTIANQMNTLYVERKQGL